MSESPRRGKRRLYDWEVEEFSSIFGDTLDYPKIWVHEGAKWPDLIDRVGRALKGMPAPGKTSHNAVTLGNHCYFPVSLPASYVNVGHPEAYKLDWLVHELTHAWQYQHQGWGYLWKALQAQFRDKALAYDYGGERGLLDSREKGKKFDEFNPEQQGNITQAYYVRKRAQTSTTAWDPYIQELKSMRKTGLTKDR
jgi:hypothetical protein